MDLSVVIVNYNVKYFLMQCLRSLQSATNNISSEIFVVDNASSDGSIEYLQPRFPGVTFIQNKENLGFAKANNIAIQMSKGKYVLLLNPDTIVGNDSIAKCIELMTNYPDAGGAGVYMMNTNGTFAFESRRGFPSPLTSLFKITGLCNLFPYSRLFGKYYLRYLDKDKINRIDVISGAFMFLRKEALDKAGLLDEDFFMYGEDIDLSYRISKAGYRNYYVPGPILHYKGESTKKDSYRYIQIFYNAMLIFFRKHFPHYTVLFSFPIKSAIYIRASAAHINRIIRKIKSITGLKKRQNTPLFLIFGSESTVKDLRWICHKNELAGKHNYIIANESTNGNKFPILQSAKPRYTHIVYDEKVFSYSYILKCLSTSSRKGIEIGIYSPNEKILVTPQRVYK